MEPLPSSLTIQKVYDRYNQAFYEYDEIEQIEKNMEELKVASHAIDVLQRQRHEEIFSLLPRYTVSMPFFLSLFRLISASMTLMRLIKCGINLIRQFNIVMY